MLSRNGKLDPIWTRAENGNVALIGEIDFTQADEVTLALGFGQHPEEAAHRVRSSLNFGFDRACNDYIAHWRETLEQAAPLVPASPSDSVFCWNMARNAVHAAMAGNTEMLIGRWHGRFVHVPMPLATRFRKQVDVTQELWLSVLEATGQPASWGEEAAA